MESSRAEHNERMPGTPQLPRRKQREVETRVDREKEFLSWTGLTGCDLPMILIEDRVERSPADNQRNSPISRTMQVSRIDATIRIDFHERYRTFEKREPKFKRFDISVFVVIHLHA